MDSSNELFLNLEEYKKCAQKVKVLIELEKPLAYFSVSPERFYQGNASQLRSLYYPKPKAFPLYLSAPLKCSYRKTSNHFYDEYLDNLLYGICDNSFELLCPFGNKGSHGWRVRAPLVCQLELLQTLMCTPFRPNENWLILAINYRDTVYLCLENPDEQPWTEDRMRRSAMETMLKHQVYKAFNETQAEGSPEECSEFNYILNCRLNDLSVIYSAPINGAVFESSEAPSHSKILELMFLECKLGEKLRRMDGGLFTELYSPEEALKWWTEGQLKGAKNFMLALADPYGRVQSLEPISCEKLCRDSKDNWSADFCQQFLSQFLGQVREHMKNVNDPSTIYEFNYVAQKRCIYWNKGSGQRLSFIPDWYRLILEGNE
ncbi:protein cutoff-like [Drosophila kikkawai]|uniref:Decapping nuclease n=1 Tax=Drosophila kikkawai TaxID=30033 RepID=A0A6P4I4N2_DROKI|nr:protein cutoff-like [Drosophila kikkawai]